MFLQLQVDWTKIDDVYDELNKGSDKVIRYVLDCDKGFWSIISGIIIDLSVWLNVSQNKSLWWRGKSHL